MSQLNIQYTHLNMEKDQKEYFLAKETYHFSGRSNQM